MSFILNTLGNIGFNWHVAMLNFINFLFILLILNKFFFKKISKTIKERDSHIRKGLQDASNASKNLSEAEDKSRLLIGEAKVKSQGIINEAADHAESIARDIKLKAEHESESLKNKLKQAIGSAESKVIDQMSIAAPEMFKLAFAKILSDKVTSEVNEDYIKSILQQK